MHYYTYNRILSYNAILYILIGERGCGKSYGAKNYVIKQYLKNRSNFLYLRRYENELKSVFEINKNNPKDFFDDIRKDFPRSRIKSKT